MSANDPVSEFLAREQTALADIGDDDFVATAAAPGTQSPIPTQQINDEHNGFLSNGGGELTNGTSGFNAAIFEEDDMQSMDQFTGNRMSPTLTNSRSQTIQPEEEPENIKKWREQHEELIKKKDNDEERKKEELRQQAKKELDQINAQRKSLLDQRKKHNRERQATSGMDAKSDEKEANAAMWERVARMIEGNSGGVGIGSGKVNKLAGQSSALGKDTTRMKQLILLYARGEQNEKSPSPEIP